MSIEFIYSAFRLRPRKGSRRLPEPLPEIDLRRLDSQQVDEINRAFMNEVRDYAIFVLLIMVLVLLVIEINLLL